MKRQKTAQNFDQALEAARQALVAKELYPVPGAGEKQMRVDAKSLTRELEWCARFIGRKTAIPILQNVLLRKRDDLLTLIGMDLEVAGNTSIEVDGGRDFEITVPIAQLLKYLKKVEEPEITLLPKRRRVQAHPLGKGEEGPLEPEIEVIHGICVEHADASLSIEGLPSESYPELPKAPAVQFEIGGLEKAIPRARVSISKEESRFTLNGALLDVCPQSARFISTDGHRLAIVDAELIDPAEKMRALIPKTALVELVRLGDCAGVSADKDHVFFTRGDRTILARKLTGSFPDWERVVPKSFKYQVEVQSEPLRRVIDRVALFADERSRAVHVSINSSFELSAKTNENSVSGRVPFAGPKFAYPYESGFSARICSTS